MDDKEILGRIHALVEEEHELRSRKQRDEISAEAEHERLRELEESLDQCWDLLRRRRAKREYGENPDDATPAEVSQVEHYIQ